MMIKTGAEIMELYDVEVGLEIDSEYRLTEVDEEEGSSTLFDTAGHDYEYREGKTYRVDSIDGIATIAYVYGR